jgi:hypothetical protein
MGRLSLCLPLVSPVGFLSKCHPSGSRRDVAQKRSVHQIRIRSALAVAINGPGGAHDSDHRGGSPQAEPPRGGDLWRGTRGGQGHRAGDPPADDQAARLGRAVREADLGPSSRPAAWVTYWPNNLSMPESTSSMSRPHWPRGSACSARVARTRTTPTKRSQSQSPLCAPIRCVRSRPPTTPKSCGCWPNATMTWAGCGPG